MLRVSSEHISFKKEWITQVIYNVWTSIQVELCTWYTHTDFKFKCIEKLSCRCLNILVNVDQVFCVCCCKRQNEKTESNTQARNSESNIQLSVVAYEPYNQTKQTTATTTKKKHNKHIKNLYYYTICIQIVILEYYTFSHTVLVINVSIYRLQWWFLFILITTFHKSLYYIY